MALSLDFTNMMGAALPHGAGITAAQWSAAAEGFASVHARVHGMQEELGFLTLPRNDALRDATLAVAAHMRGRFDDVLLLGIGGSALGPIALRTALRPPAWNALSADARGNAPRLHVLDNVDPATIAAVYQRLYPLFQQTYEDLGYPGQYFNDRLVGVIDHLLETPTLPRPVLLVQPSVLYEFADPAIESLSAGQKLLLRMGPSHATVVKAKLKALRSLIAAPAVK